MSLAAFREHDPEAWKVFQAVLRLWLDQSPHLVRMMSAAGVGREACHESAERLIDAGLLKLFQDDIGFQFRLWDPIRRQYTPCGGVGL
jgi:hypothetical protein